MYTIFKINYIISPKRENHPGFIYNNYTGKDNTIWSDGGYRNDNLPYIGYAWPEENYNVISTIFVS